MCLTLLLLFCYSFALTPPTHPPYTVLERVHELSSTLPRVSTAAAWVLYTTLPGLLTLSTVEVAHRLTGLSAALDLSTEATLHYLLLQEEEEEEGPSSSCSCRHVAFLQPDAVRSRLGLVAKVGRLQHAAAVVLMRQHPALWLMSSRLLTPRCVCVCVVGGWGRVSRRGGEQYGCSP